MKNELKRWRYLQRFEAAQTLEHPSADRLQLVSGQQQLQNTSGPIKRPLTDVPEFIITYVSANTELRKTLTPLAL